MLQKKIHRGVLAPLFYRIVDEKDAVIGNQFLTPKELQESIVNELSLILNTRCTIRKVIYRDHIQTIPLFGFPDFFGLSDFSTFDGANSEDWPMVARSIQTAIQAAEPRLREVRVTIENFNTVEQRLSVSVSAFIEESKLLKEIHFPLDLQYDSNRGGAKSAA